MQFSENWLRELIKLPLNREQLLEKFNFLGLEVDGCESAAPAFSGVVVAEVTDINPHPNADRLRVCTVDTGAECLQIVCGAANAHQGMKAPLATVGAVLPGDFKINKGKLRGVESFGMLCSEQELGLAEKADGLLALPADAPVGTDVREYLDLDDAVIEIDLTPNRGDCLGMMGLARECAAALKLQQPVLNIEPIKPQLDDQVSVELMAVEACPRYCGRVIRNIDPNAKTPLWMIEKLRRGGIRDIHPVVDITNFVMLELGQPMHGFDLNEIKGGVRVRMAEPNEKLILLDGSELSLNNESLVIADHERALALAGVMGGEHSGVSDDTRDILFESAFFAPAYIMGKARAYGLHTDSSHRFERGVDPGLQKLAIERATELLLQIAGGEAGPVVDVQHQQTLPTSPTITLRQQAISRKLGCDVPADEVQDILQSMGCTVKSKKDQWQVSSPSYRFDLNIEVDLIEELARIRGYEHIPRRIPAFTPQHPTESELVVDIVDVQQQLIDSGYQEVITYSFIDPEIQQLVEPTMEALRLSNPISEDLSVMRTSLLAGLLSTLSYNVKRQQQRVSIFETGTAFVPKGDEISEQIRIAGLRYGPRFAEHWQSEGDNVDFFDIKGDVERLLQLGPGMEQVRFVPEEHPALHPGQSARIYAADQAIGWLGALHPKLVQKLDLSYAPVMFEMQLDSLLHSVTPRFSLISRYPSIRRDFAIVVDEAISWEQIKNCILGAAPEFLQKLSLFDIYTGKGVTLGRKSYAIGLILQEISRTLTDDEIESATGEILAVLSEKLGATLRE